uniref:Uncharacterized protein n=1 Tax=Rhizophora mucronata TaxID=61149 RepID=A0A2P2MBN4_RHIMU
MVYQLAILAHDQLTSQNARVDYHVSIVLVYLVSYESSCCHHCIALCTSCSSQQQVLTQCAQLPSRYHQGE